MTHKSRYGIIVYDIFLLQADTMTICPHCGSQLREGVVFCTRCGQRFGGPGSNKIQSASRLSDIIAVNMNDAAHATGAGPTPQERNERLSKIQKKHIFHAIPAILLLVGGLILLIYCMIIQNSLEKPVQYMMLSDGAVLSTTRSIARFDEQGKLLWRRKSFNNKPIDRIIGFDLGKDGSIYVSSPYGYYQEKGRATGEDKWAIEVLTAKGEWQRSMGKDTLSNEFSLAVLKDGNLLVLDTDNNKLVLFSPDGKMLKEIGGKGSAVGQFRSPGGLAVASDGTIYVSDAFNARIQRFTSGYRPLKPWRLSHAMLELNSRNTAPIEIKNDPDVTLKRMSYLPQNIVIDEKRGRIYISMLKTVSTDPVGHLAVFDMRGNFIRHKVLKTRDGEKADPFMLRMAHGGLVAIVDSESAIAGEWDPSGGMVLAPSNTGVRAETDRLWAKAESPHKYKRYGWILIAVGFAGLVIFISATTVIANKQFQEQSPPKSAPALTGFPAFSAFIKKYSEIVTFFIILLVGACALYVPMNYVITDAFNLVEAPFLLVLMVLMIGLFIWRMKKSIRKGAFSQACLVQRDMILGRCKAWLHEKLASGEQIVDALWIPPFQEALVLTNMRVFKISASSSGAAGKFSLNLFSSSKPFPDIAIRDIAGVTLKDTGLSPFIALEFKTMSGLSAKAAARDLPLAQAFIERIEWLRRHPGGYNDAFQKT